MATAQMPTTRSSPPRVTMTTSMGEIQIVVIENEAPITAGSFVQHVDDGFFHGEDGDGATGLADDRGTLAMPQTPAPDSATSQLYIKVNDNCFLNHGSSENPGAYVVFAEVLEGIDAADSISLVAQDTGNRPLEAVVIESVTRD